VYARSPGGRTVRRITPEEMANPDCLPEGEDLPPRIPSYVARFQPNPNSRIRI
jgi:hypothetical protein